MSSNFTTKMPHPLHEKAGTCMVYGVLLIIFMDDVSVNISKQWNKHFVIYISNANMPWEMIEKEFCVRFVTSSPFVSPMELMRGCKESIKYQISAIPRYHDLTSFTIRKAAESGIVTWDCKNSEEMLLCPYGIFWAGDNPMQAEECGHAGLACNHFCQTCHVGRTKVHKSSDEGYNELSSVGSQLLPIWVFTDHTLFTGTGYAYPF